VTQTKSLGNTTEHLSRRDFQREKIRALGPHEAITVEAGSRIDEIIPRMQQGSSGGAALVMRDKTLVGIVTERDILLKVLGHDLDPATTVDEIMTHDPQTLTADAFLWEALAMMEQGHYRHIPLVDGTAPAGILSQQNVLEYVAEAFPQEILNLPPRPHQKMEKEEGG
jgi:signal-transduction protein with cAMP-binding, CBS, and nucleotidyltransferase domain